MARLPEPSADELPAGARKLRDELVARRGRIDGMYRTLLNHPALLEHVAALGTFFRFGGGVLPADVRELAILAAAREMNAAYEWVKHAPCARDAGLSGEVIEAVRTGRTPGGIAPERLAVLEAVRIVLARRSLPEAVQAVLESAYGVEGVVELVVLCGFYGMIAGVIFAFDVPLPEGEAWPF